MISPQALVSVVIPNYNYARFVSDAIDSALGLDWPSIEVIVVDDGSDDDSHAVIARYADRITAVFQTNAGQSAACNVGFARSHGEVVIFLDSDDKLHPSLMKELAAVWRSGISKVQFQMQVIDSAGRPTGAVLPQYHVVPSPEQIRTWAIAAGAYPTPPGSGSAYARWFLETIFPLDAEERASDSYCLTAAPHLGDVVTLRMPLVSYRVHGGNHGAMTTLDLERIAVEVERAAWRFRYGQRVARSVGVVVPDDVFHKSMATLPYRLVSIRLAPERHPIRGDTTAGILRHMVKACFVPQGHSRRARAALLGWTAMVAVTPRPIAERLALWRFSSSSRPKGLLRVLRVLRVVKG